MKNIFFILFLVLFISVSFSQTFGPVSCEDLNSTDLATELTYQVDSRIDGLSSPDGVLALYTVRGNSTTPWTKNSNVWTNRGEEALDFSGVSVWNSTMGYNSSVTMISPRHFITAHHYGPAVGATVVFIDNDGNIVTRTISAKLNPVAIDGPCDVEVGLLNSDVPESISYYPVLTEAQKDSYLLGARDIPMVVFNKQEKALISDLIEFEAVCTYIVNGVCIEDYTYYSTNHADSSDLNRALFYELLVDGDSGNPGFFIINNRPVFDFYSHFATGGENLSMYFSEINEAMSTLQGEETSYQLSTYDLNCFSSDVDFSPIDVLEESMVVSNNAANGDSVGFVDVNTTSSLDLSYLIVSGNDAGIFSLDRSTGELIIEDSNALSFSSTVQYDLNIMAGYSPNRITGTPLEPDYGIIRVSVLPAGTTRVVYFYPSVDNNWSTVGNWYSDANHETLLGGLPGATDGVILLGSLTVNASTSGFIVPKYINSSANQINFNGSGDLNTIIIGDANFSGSIVFKGAIVGDVNFYDTTYIYGSTNSYFKDNYLVETFATVEGDVQFFNSSFNNGKIFGDVIFNDTSYPASNNNSLITGNAVFNYVTNTRYVSPASFKGWGTILGLVKNSSGQLITDFDLNNYSKNYGTVPGNVIFSRYSDNVGFVDGNVTYLNVATTTLSPSSEWRAKTVGGLTKNASGQTITDFIFDNVENSGYVSANTTFNNSNAKNWGTVVGAGETIFNGGSANLGTVIGKTIFNDSSYNVSQNQNVGLSGGITISHTFRGYVIGDVNFNDSSYNDRGTIEGDVNINGSSYNAGSIIGDVVVCDSTAANMNVVTGNIFYSTVTGGTITTSRGFGTATGTIRGIDGVDINVGVFNSYAINYGLLDYATFNGTASNATTGIVGTAVFDVNSKNKGTVTGDALFNGDFSENNYYSTWGVVNGVKTRYYSSDINVSTRDFISHGPWKIVADGCVVEMSDQTKYDGVTIFQTENGGSFVGPSIHSILDGNVIVNGFDMSDLNVLVSDQNLFNKKFVGLKPVRFELNDQNLMSFDFNFSASDLNLEKVRIEKGDNHLIIDLGGQLQENQTKIIYLNDNNYTHFCVKDAIISSISEISSNCNGVDEYYFTNCAGGAQTIGGITCNDLGDVIKIEGLRHSAVLGKIVLQTSGSCTPLWNCNDWGDCVDGNQTRNCVKINNCGAALFGKPSESRICVVDVNVVVDTCVEDWSCSNWGDCVNDLRTRSCVDLNSCNTILGKPSLSEYCKIQVDVNTVNPDLNYPQNFGSSKDDIIYQEPILPYVIGGLLILVIIVAFVFVQKTNKSLF